MDELFEALVDWNPIDTFQRGPTTVEANADRLLHLLPRATVRRTRDVVELTGDEADGLVLLITPEALEIRLRKTEWTRGTHAPALTSTLSRRVELGGVDDKEIEQLLTEAREAWDESRRTCSDCGRRFPADHFIDGMGVCHGCGERNHGVVY